MYNSNQNYQQPYQQPSPRGSYPNQYQPAPMAYRPTFQQDNAYVYKQGQQTGLTSSARSGFIAKVYTLVTIQLLFTVGLGYFGYNSQWFRQTFASPALVIVISVLLLGLSIVIGCCTDFFRRFALPIFIVFTLLMALLVAIAITAYKSKVVLLSVGTTLLIVIALTLYAWFTDTDFSGCRPYLCVFGIVMLAFGIACIFWRDPIVQLIYACLGALLFSIYIIFDTQMILGKGDLKYSLDDAYLAAIKLYLDIVNLFLSILRIVRFAS